MIQRWNQLYQELLTELAYYRNQGLPFVTETEYCFHVTEKFRGLMREELSSYRFNTVEDEVHFFKTIKPRFVAETEYACLLNFAGNFCPPPDYLPQLVEFWKRQAERLIKFQDKHRDFYQYHVNGDTQLDLVYYTRLLSEDHLPVSDKTNSDYDILAGQLMAHERYAEYAKKELEKLQMKNPQ
jgi:hypothetical protein